jgi:plastocyanin
VRDLTRNGMRKVGILMALGGLAAISSVGGGSAAAGQGTPRAAAAAPTVTLEGGFQITPNESLTISFHFQPKNVTVERGRRVEFVDATDKFSREPHTVTIVRKRQVPSTVKEAFACFEGGPCEAALKRHGRPPKRIVERKGSRRGLDAPRDSRWISPGATIKPLITAPVGTKLHYLCAIHPWMQGTITVQ